MTSPPMLPVPPDSQGDLSVALRSPRLAGNLPERAPRKFEAPFRGILSLEARPSFYFQEGWQQQLFEIFKKGGQVRVFSSVPRPERKLPCHDWVLHKLPSGCPFFSEFVGVFTAFVDDKLGFIFQDVRCRNQHFEFGSLCRRQTPCQGAIALADWRGKPRCECSPCTANYDSIPRARETPKHPEACGCGRAELAPKRQSM